MTTWTNIPKYSKYLINPDGVVYNKHTGKYLNGSINPAGYKNIRLTDDNGKCTTWGLHRLLAYVFINPNKDIKDLVVNHIDGIKSNNSLVNLEWVTHKENLEHAGKLKLTSKCLPVQVRDTMTGVVTNYPSATACANHLGLSKDAILYRLKMGDTRIFPENKQYRLASGEVPWYVPININSEILLNGTSKKVNVRLLETNEVLEFKNLKTLADFLKVSPSTLTVWLKMKDQPVLPGFIQIKYAHDTTPWRDIDDMYVELSLSIGTVPVYIQHEETGDKKIFIKCRECAEYMGIKPNTLNERLKSNGRKVYPDGYRYSYYTGPNR